jgi:hypothetical protein
MLSALLFPIVINKVDSQQLKFIILGSIAAVGAVLVVILRLMNSKQVKEQA